jgi:hypothetical protein
MTGRGFSLDTRDVLTREPDVVFDEGVVYRVTGPEAWDERLVPHVTVAWLDEPPGVTLADTVREDLARMLSRPEAVLLDRQPVSLAGVESVRTFVAELGPGGVPTASEQWRTIAGGRRWTVTATTTLADQAVWGPRLGAVAATFRPA